MREGWGSEGGRRRGKVRGGGQGMGGGRRVGGNEGQKG